MRRLTDYKKKTLTSHDGLKLYYETTGNNKNILFFVHGMGGDVAAWDEERLFFQHLGYSTVALDLRGHGFSDHPKSDMGYALEHFAQDIEDVLKAEKIEKYVLIGHCFGGMIALVYQGLYPRDAEALILIDTTYKPPFISENGFNRRFLSTITPVLAKYSPSGYTPRHVDYMKKGFEHDFEIGGLISVLRYNSLKTYLSTMQEVFALDVVDTIKNIKIPTLIVNGEEDTIVRPEVAEEIHHWIKGSELSMIRGANHPVVINNPMELSIAIHEFLQKIKY